MSARQNSTDDCASKPQGEMARTAVGDNEQVTAATNEFIPLEVSEVTDKTAVGDTTDNARKLVAVPLAEQLLSTDNLATNSMKLFGIPQAPVITEIHHHHHAVNARSRRSIMSMVSPADSPSGVYTEGIKSYSTISEIDGHHHYHRPPVMPQEGGTHSTGSSSSAHIRDVVDDIRELHKLHQEGIITQEEFKKVKTKLIDEGISTHTSQKKSKTTPSSSSSTSSSSSESGFMVRHRAKLWDVTDDVADVVAVLPTRHHRKHRTIHSPNENVGTFSMTLDNTTPSVTNAAARGATTVTTERTSDRTSTEEISEKRSLLHKAAKKIVGLRASVNNRSMADVQTSPKKKRLSAVRKLPLSERNTANGEHEHEMLPYGTFIDGSGAYSTTVHKRPNVPQLLSSEIVQCFFANSRGRLGNSFESVILKETELKDHLGQLSLHALRAHDQVVAKIPPVVRAMEVVNFSLHLGDNIPLSSEAADADETQGVARNASSSPFGEISETRDHTHHSPNLSSQHSPLRISSSTGRKPLLPVRRAHIKELQSNSSGDKQEGLSAKSHDSKTKSSSTKEAPKHLDWYWIDVVGRDDHNGQKEYKTVIAELTKTFKLCPSLLAERDHSYVFPQIVEAPTVPRQYMIVLRVANPEWSMTDDSAWELTNRWIIVVDLTQKIAITLHRVDTLSMAKMRNTWRSIMRSGEVSFQELLLKLLDDAVATFQIALEIHGAVLDICEAKMVLSASKTEEYWANKTNVGSGSGAAGMRTDSGNLHSSMMMQGGNELDHKRILEHFTGARESRFLRALITKGSHHTIERGEMNTFLYHMHRRSNVHHRILSQSQEVLGRTYLRLRLSSKEYAKQMTGYCTDLANKALELREDSQQMLSMHINLVTFRTNEFMGLLTKFDVVFGPLAFIAGVYGTNFMWVPEYEMRYGYLMFWGLCILVASLVYFIFIRNY